VESPGHLSPLPEKVLLSFFSERMHKLRFVELPLSELFERI
jgi:hypothetical protein